MKYLFIIMIIMCSACVEDSKSEAIQVAIEAREALERNDCFFFEDGLIRVQLHDVCLDIMCGADESYCGGEG